MDFCSEMDSLIGIPDLELDGNGFLDRFSCVHEMDSLFGNGFLDRFSRFDVWAVFGIGWMWIP
jgi:hypothetical protein